MANRIFNQKKNQHSQTLEQQGFARLPRGTPGGMRATKNPASRRGFCLTLFPYLEGGWSKPVIQLEQLGSRFQKPALDLPLFVPLFQGDERPIPLRVGEEMGQFCTLANFLLNLLNGEVQMSIGNFAGGVVDLGCWCCVLHTRVRIACD